MPEPFEADPQFRKSLTQLAVDQSSLFSEVGLADRLRKEINAARDLGPSLQILGRSISHLTSSLANLSVLSALGIQLPTDTFASIRNVFMPALLQLPDINFQGRRKADPPWRSDLGTADVGVNLAVALHFNSPAITDRRAFVGFIRSRCLDPIVADWIDDRTHIHCLDSMGHNWWSVITSGAGVVAAVLDDRELATLIADRLRQWAHYPGNDFARKQRNFGSEGDYVEGYNYCEYALTNACAFAFFFPDLRIVPDLISSTQANGLARWLKNSFVNHGGHFHPQRFGDVGLYRKPHLEVWHAVAKAIGDEDLVEMAHAIKPAPESALEILTWPSAKGRLATATTGPATLHSDLPPQPPSVDVFPTSGLAFLRREGQLLSVRAGEFWNHNHLDAGSFILHQNDTVWIDDSGTCSYGKPQYTEYYIQPEAHNVSYAPDLVPPGRRGFDESLPYRARYLLHEVSDYLSVLCADTGILSASSLMRSYRWFFQLSGGVALIWDDLAAYRPVPFTSLLHSACVYTGLSDCGLRLRHDQQSCQVEFFSDPPASFNLSKGHLAEDEPAPPSATPYDAGHTFQWRTPPALRAKFAIAMGVGLRSATWTYPIKPPTTSPSLSAGTPPWQGSISTADAVWDVWFNPLADGRLMHQNCIARYGPVETDAYALLVRKPSDGSPITMHAIEASFVRRGGAVLFSNPERQILVSLQ